MKERAFPSRYCWRFFNLKLPRSFQTLDILYIKLRHYFCKSSNIDTHELTPAAYLVTKLVPCFLEVISHDPLFIELNFLGTKSPSLLTQGLTAAKTNILSINTVPLELYRDHQSTSTQFNLCEYCTASARPRIWPSRKLPCLIWLFISLKVSLPRREDNSTAATVRS